MFSTPPEKRRKPPTSPPPTPRQVHFAEPEVQHDERDPGERWDGSRVLARRRGVEAAVVALAAPVEGAEIQRGATTVSAEYDDTCATLPSIEFTAATVLTEELTLFAAGKQDKLHVPWEGEPVTYRRMASAIEMRKCPGEPDLVVWNGHEFREADDKAKFLEAREEVHRLLHNLCGLTHGVPGFIPSSQSPWNW